MNYATTSACRILRAMRTTIAILAIALGASAAADEPKKSVKGKIYEPTEMKTVIGPVNQYAADGVLALREGDAERALPLLQKGLKRAQGDRDFVIGLSNICAAYVLLGEFSTAVTYCDRGLEIKPRFWRAFNNRALAYLGMNDLEQAKRDIDAGLALAPQSLNLKKTLDVYDQMMNPVEPVIIIDDTDMAGR